MLVPAIAYSAELNKKFNLMRYSDEAICFNGCIEFGGLQISDEPSEGKFQYAILDKGEVVGYMGYYVDFYCSGMWGIGLVSFDDKPNRAIASAVLHILKKIQEYNLHRVEFRAIEGNHANFNYENFIKLANKSGEFYAREIKLLDTFKDRQGNYRDSYIYEFIRRSDNEG